MFIYPTFFNKITVQYRKNNNDEKTKIIKKIVFN